MAEASSQDGKASSQGGKGDAAEGLKAILARVADFFDIFDLSFIISGAVALAAIYFWGWRAGVVLPALPEGWLGVIGPLIASYVLGLLCFTFGRWLRVGWPWRHLDGSPQDRFLSVLKGHGLHSSPPFADYLARTEARGEARLYVRLWAEVRDCADVTASFSLLRRYWVMAATLDGLVIAITIWIAVLTACLFGWGDTRKIGEFPALAIITVLALSALACRHEAGRFSDYQMEELVATIATRQSRR